MAHGGVLGSRARAGFTILELLVSLTVLALVASVAIPWYFSQGEVTLEKAGIQLANDLRRAQNRAAYLGTTTSLEFFDDGDGYRIIEGPTPEKARLVGGRNVERRYSADGVFEGVWIELVRFDGQPFQARFDPRGQSLDSGEVHLRFEDERRILKLERTTGMVTMQGSTSGWTDNGL